MAGGGPQRRGPRPGLLVVERLRFWGFCREKRENPRCTATAPFLPISVVSRLSAPVLDGSRCLQGALCPPQGRVSCKKSRGLSSAARFRTKLGRCRVGGRPAPSARCLSDILLACPCPHHPGDSPGSSLSPSCPEMLGRCSPSSSEAWIIIITIMIMVMIMIIIIINNR